jgi:hypothetical protein
VTKFTNLTPLSLLISCKLSFPIASFKISSLPNFGERGSVVVKALGYKPEGRGFETL